MVTRYRKVKKYGDTWVIKLYPIDSQDFEIKEGDEVDISDIVVPEKTKKQKKESKK